MDRPRSSGTSSHTTGSTTPTPAQHGRCSCGRSSRLGGLFHDTYSSTVDLVYQFIPVLKPM
ncbi:putative polysaccharide deacetylase, partial [Mycobacterium xenopi 4042]